MGQREELNRVGRIMEYNAPHNKEIYIGSPAKKYNYIRFLVRKRLPYNKYQIELMTGDENDGLLVDMTVDTVEHIAYSEDNV